MSGDAYPCLEPRLRGRLPMLDGVRGLAILSVMVYRFGLQGDFYLSSNADDQLPYWVVQLLTLGSRGVDLFFVLSGFLITGLLLDAKGREDYFASFYVRRILRIFPLYYATLCVFFFVLPRWYDDFPMGMAAADQKWFWLHSANLGMLLRGDWCYGRLDHFWSLAIEEHFYLVWPLVVHGIQRSNLKRLCAVGIVCGPLARMAADMAGMSGVAAETFSLLKLDGLLAGAYLAIALRDAGGTASLRRPALYSLLCCTILLTPTLVLDKRCWTIPETLFAIAFAAAIVIALDAKAGGLRQALIGNGVFRFFGKYSYAMYLFQNPLVPCAAYWFTSDDCERWCGSFAAGRVLYVMVMMLLVTLAALLSWNLWEKHFLKLKDRWSHKAPPLGMAYPMMESPSGRFSPNTASSSSLERAPSFETSSK